MTDTRRTSEEVHREAHEIAALALSLAQLETKLRDREARLDALEKGVKVLLEKRAKAKRKESASTT